jgi:hypothetical protein
MELRPEQFPKRDPEAGKVEKKRGRRWEDVHGRTKNQRSCPSHALVRSMIQRGKSQKPPTFKPEAAALD